MVATAETVEWIQVRNEVEALMLEYSLIKQHRPRFNVRLRDDKSYPFLAVTLDEEWPRAMVMRGRKRKGVRYFGPYGHAYAIRDTLDLLLRTFPIRTCSPNKFNTARAARPAVPAVPHREVLGPVRRRGRRPSATTSWSASCSTSSTATPTPIVQAARTARCSEAADELEFERAARAARPARRPCSKAIERQQMVAERNEDLDVIGIADDELEAAVQVFYVRKGRVVGRKGFIVDKVEDAHARRARRPHPRGASTARSRPLGVPKQVLVPVEPESPSRVRGVAVRAARLAGAGAGARSGATSASCRRPSPATPRRSSPATGCAGPSDHNRRARALNELQDALGLPEAPLRIECYDMAHIQGTDYVGSMVVLEDGLPRKSEYRRFKVKGVDGQRRLRGHGGGAHPPAHRLPRRARPPGRRAARQVRLPAAAAAGRRRQGPARVAERVVRELGLDDEIPVASLAKRFEEVYVPGRSEPVQLPRQSEALYLLQRIRDEAHRFANTFHRELRGKRMTKSVLDDVPGLGPDPARSGW